MGRSLYQKVLELHTVRRLDSGQHQLLVGLHLVNEVSSPQAFGMLRARGWTVLFPRQTFATTDHVIPTRSLARPYRDASAESLEQELERNVSAHGLTYFAPRSGRQGIVHVVAPELGLTQPGMTICCGDSHTSTHGAFGNVAFGIGATQVRDVLVSQTVAVNPLKVRRIEVQGRLGDGVEAKDVILHLIHRLGGKGGVGFAYEYAGAAVERMTMDERMTLCNMSIEGGAQIGYVNPDATTYAYLRGRPFAPPAARWDEAVAFWEGVRSDADAIYDDRVVCRADDIEPMVTWGITPMHAIPVQGRLPEVDAFAADDRMLAEEAYRYMGFSPGQPVLGTPIDVAFIGSCANARLSDFRRIAELLARRPHKVSPRVRALVVPGSEPVLHELIARGYARQLEEAGFEVRNPGCSLCIGMNADALEGQQVCASTSTRNFKGRQGSATGRTLLMSPLMVAAAAFAGEVVDARELFAGEMAS